MKIGHIKGLYGEPRLCFFQDNEAIDINLLWTSYFETQGYYHAKSMADQRYPSLLSSWLKLYQKDSIKVFQDTLLIFNQLKKAGVFQTTLSNEYIKTSYKLLKPLDQINLYRDFYSHEKHVKKGFEKRKEPVPAPWYELPVYYKGSTSSFIGPEETIPWPSYTDKLDYELELGLVIMGDGKNIKEEKAFEHVFGFTIFNDISARDIQKKEMAVRLGPSKGKDFASVIGPWIVTADEFHFKSPNLKMQAFINDEKWSEGMSADANFNWEQMISFASREEWVLSTDFMGQGTVGTGCGLELDRWIQPGDLIHLDIDKIGSLKNTVGVKNEL